MEMLNALILALLASSAVGLGTSFIIQLGKLFIPKWFPDASADNWRLGLIVLTAVGVVVARAFGLDVQLPAIEAIATSLASLGVTLMPLLVLIASAIAKASYKNLLKGVSLIGFSYSK